MGANDLDVYSVGISTRGVAEVRMAQANPKSHIIATSIDPSGLQVAEQYIKARNFESRITLKLEDVSGHLSYHDDTFDFIYARLILHYLSKSDLINTLGELYRVTRSGGRIFAVVRSVESHDAKRPNATTDAKTMLTTYTFTNPVTGTEQASRYFHTEDSIKSYLQQAGFTPNYVKTITEQIYLDFARTQPASQPDRVIEVLATK